MEHFLAMLVQAWIRRGATNAAISINHGRAWELRLCWRAKLIAWIGAAMFTTGLFGAVLLAQGRKGGWLLVCGYVCFVLLFQYYVGFVTRYRVHVDETGIRLYRFLLRTRAVKWSDVTDFSLDGDEDTVRFKVRTGKPLVIYSSLNGLSAVRRCLAAFTTLQLTAPHAWTHNDQVLCEKIPSWRCDPEDLEDDPFRPLGSWREVHFEEST